MHVGEICTRSVVTCAADLNVVELAQLMRYRHVTDVIVIEQRDGRPGVLTVDDVAEFLAGELAEVTRISPRRPAFERQVSEPSPH